MHISSIIRGSGMVFYGSFVPLRNEELLTDNHQFLVKSLSPSEREDSSKQSCPRSVPGQLHKSRFQKRSGKISRRSVSRVREGSLLKWRRLQQTAGEGYTHTGGSVSGALVWRMAHSKNGGRGGEHSEVTDNFASLVFDDSRKAPEYGRVLSRTTSKKFSHLYTDYERGVKQSNLEQTLKRHVLSLCEVLQKDIRACLSRTFFDGPILKRDIHAKL